MMTMIINTGNPMMRRPNSPFLARPEYNMILVIIVIVYLVVMRIFITVYNVDQ